MKHCNRRMEGASRVRDNSWLWKNVEVSRHALIDLLMKSQREVLAVPLDFLKTLGWVASPAVEPKPLKTTSIPLEGKREESRVIIEIVDDDDSETEADDLGQLGLCSKERPRYDVDRNALGLLGNRCKGSTQINSKDKCLRQSWERSVSNSPEEIVSSKKRMYTTEMPKAIMPSLAIDNEQRSSQNGYAGEDAHPSPLIPSNPVTKHPPRQILSNSCDGLAKTGTPIERSQVVDIQTNINCSTQLLKRDDEATVTGTPDRKSLVQQKRTKSERLLYQLSTTLNPGILTVCHKPKLFPSQSHFDPAKAREFASFMMAKVREQMLDYASEIQPECSYPIALTKKFPDCVVEPTRVDRGYFKTHLSSHFVNHFAEELPSCVRIKRNVSRKGIAFVSTSNATLCDTHYDQDTSFLLLFQGTKEVFFAPPCMVDRLRNEHPVLSHSSIFEDVNPFLAATGTLWQFATLHAGDGLLLPQGWIHSIKSAPGTVAISFQVESSGVDATSPYVRRSRETDPEDLRHLRHLFIGLNDDVGESCIENNVAVARGDVPASNKSMLKKKDLISMSDLGFGERIAEAKNGLLEESPVESQHSSVTASQNPKGKAEPSEASVSRSKKHLSLAATCGLPTKKRKVSDVAVASSMRRSRRQRLECGVEGCKNVFPVDDGLMWVMLLSLEDDDDASETCVSARDSSLPLVPSDHPKHLICFDCRPQSGSGVLNPQELLNESDKQEIREWGRYNFYAASRIDYEKWANHSGENGKILMQFCS